MSVSYKFTSVEGDQFLTLFAPDGTITCATPDTHSNFERLVALAMAEDESVYDEAEVGKAIQKRFDNVVNGRVAIRNGVVYFDDDPMDNALTKAILSFLEADEDFTPLVRFFENVMANPQPESREQFYRWIEYHDFPIDDDGNIVAYKSVYKNGDGTYRSVHSGHAFVDGVEINGQVTQTVGSVVTMPRAEVQHDPHVACHVGLHAGTFEYASTFSGDTLMHVKINPRDVVSVPHDCTSQKVRVCRYEVEGFAENKYEGARFRRDEDEFLPLDDELEDWEDEFLDEDNDISVDDVDADAEEEAATVRFVPLTIHNVDVGVQVVVNTDARLRSLLASLLEPGKTYTVNGVSTIPSGKTYVTLADTPNGRSGAWIDELLLVESNQSVANAVDTDKVVDTRLNYTKQKRDSRGRFIPKS